MKAMRTPVIVLSVLYLALVVFIAGTFGKLPDHVATHFDFNGRTNGWMNRSSHLLFTGAFGFVFPAFLVAVVYLTRYLPVSSINIPHRDYWLAPERRNETLSYLLRQSLWLASLAIGFVGGLHFMILEANAQRPPHLATPLALGAMGGFVCGVIGWLSSLILHFRRPV